MAVEVGFSGLSCQHCTDLQKKSRGCYTKAQQPHVFQGEELWRCPVKLITPFTNFCLKYYPYLKNCSLSEVMHQSAKLIEAFEIIESETDRCQKETDKRKQ